MCSDLYVNLGWLLEPPQDFTAQCRSLLDSHEGAGNRLRALASYSLDQNQLERLARLVGRALHAGADLSPLTTLRMGLVSNSTVDFLVPALIATAVRHGIALEVTTGDYGQCLQNAVSPDSAINRSAPDATLIAIDYRGLPLTASPGDALAEQAQVKAALDYLAAVRRGIQRNTHSTCIVQTLAPPPETLFGSLDGAVPGSLARIIQAVNAGLSDDLPGTQDIMFDVAHLASTVGLANWHSPRDWNLGKFPFADAFVPLYADHVCRILAAFSGKSRRCLILDLDNTLWGGVIGDDGLEGIQVAQGDPTGEAFLAVQLLALDLRSRGIVLAVSSKNEDQLARLPFRDHPEMLLRENQIAVFQANWKDKASNIRAIAQELCLGLDSMVLLDDNPAEREFVRRALPEVAVPELPEDPALYARTLHAAGYFESVNFSKEDLTRADFYQDNARRVQLQRQEGDVESYLRSLNMEISFRPFDAQGRTRIAQLINKSNQFNLTTKRYTEAQVAELQNDPRYFTAQVRLSDSFGDNGMISVVICREITRGEWEIDTWLMSCRVLGRRVENMVLKHLLHHAKKQGICKLLGIYVPTDRNMLVAEHYPQLGFTQISPVDSRTRIYELDVSSASVNEAPMKVRCVCCESQPHQQAESQDVTTLEEPLRSNSPRESVPHA